MTPPPLPDSSHIQLTITHSPIAIFYDLFTPTIEINGHKQRQRWGTHSIPLPPGTHDIAVSYPWLFSPECGKSSVRFSLAPGEVKKIHYHAGPLRYLPGKITVSQ